MPKDIQELIHPSHRDVIEAIPRGAAQSGFVGGLLLGVLGGALLAIVLPEWVAATVAGALFIGQRIYVKISDRKFDLQMAELEKRDLIWKTEGDD